MESITSKGSAGPRRSLGLALIIVVGVLVGLSLLVTAFVVLTSTSKATSIQARDRTKAELLAESGINHAKVALKRTVFYEGESVHFVTKPAFNYLAVQQSDLMAREHFALVSTAIH